MRYIYTPNHVCERSVFKTKRNINCITIFIYVLPIIPNYKPSTKPNCVLSVLIIATHHRHNISSIRNIEFCFRQLGCTEMFSSSADFSELSSSAPGKLKVSSMKHKTYVDVNEDGTEAAAVTGKSDLPSDVVRSF